MMVDYLFLLKRVIYWVSIFLLLEIEIFVKFLIFLRIIVLFVLGIKEEILLKIEYLISLFWFLNVKKKIKYIFFKDIFDLCICFFLSKIVVY